MGKLDKDRHQKELAIRYCLAHGMIPYPEVLVSSRSDVSESVEDLTDIDVLGVSATGDGTLFRVIFDCKTSNKMSAVNRAFWAGGLKEYVLAEAAIVILKNRAVFNHRLSALTINVDLHDETSFEDLGKAVDPAFPAETSYQSSIARWDLLQDAYGKYSWSTGLYSLARNAVPLSPSPWSIFRRIIAELANTKGHFDPAKKEHQAIFFDVLSSVLLLWVSIARDTRRFYEPGMKRDQFEQVLRYYLWGGRESYSIRQQLKERAAKDDEKSRVELANWKALVSFAGVVVSAPLSMFECALAAREVAIRTVAGVNHDFDHRLKELMNRNSRIRQFSFSMADYLTAATGIPRDFAKEFEGALAP